MSNIPNTSGGQPASPGAGGSLPFSAVDDALAYADAETYSGRACPELHPHAPQLAILAAEVRALRNSRGSEAMAIVRGLRAQNVALCADKARLDWLEANKGEISIDENLYGESVAGYQVGVHGDWKSHGDGESVRDAIDEAMREANTQAVGRRDET